MNNMENNNIISDIISDNIGDNMDIIIRDFTNAYLQEGFDLDDLATKYEQGKRFSVTHHISQEKNTLNIFLSSKKSAITIAEIDINQYLRDRNTFVLDTWRYIAIAQNLLMQVNPFAVNNHTLNLKKARQAEEEIKAFIMKEKFDITPIIFEGFLLYWLEKHEYDANSFKETYGAKKLTDIDYTINKDFVHIFLNFFNERGELEQLTISNICLSIAPTDVITQVYTSLIIANEMATLLGKSDSGKIRSILERITKALDTFPFPTNNH